MTQCSAACLDACWWGDRLTLKPTSVPPWLLEPDDVGCVETTTDRGAPRSSNPQNAPAICDGS